MNQTQITTPATYDVADALAAMLLSPPDTSDADLEAILACASDIPADRLDFAFGELRQGLPALYPLVIVMSITLGRAPTPQELRPVLNDCTWIDDTKGIMTIGTEVRDEDGNELASASMRVRLQ